MANINYSNWIFVLTSKYTTIKSGDNRITAKYECPNNPVSTSFSSVNVTGVPVGGEYKTIMGRSITTAAAYSDTLNRPLEKSLAVTSKGSSNSVNSINGTSNASSPSLSSTKLSSISSAISSQQLKPAPKPMNYTSSVNPNSDILHIQITSPHTGQQIPVRSNLLMTGTAFAPSSANCKVYAGLNNLKMYQPVAAAGRGGVMDYSRWYFKYSPNSALDYNIMPGSNTVIAKLDCVGNPSFVKYAAVDIVGILVDAPSVINTVTPTTNVVTDKAITSTAVDNNHSNTDDGNDNNSDHVSNHKVSTNTNVVSSKEKKHNSDHDSRDNSGGSIGKEKKHKANHSDSSSSGKSSTRSEVKIRKFFGID